MRCIKTFTETEIANQKPQSGCPKVTSPRTDSRILREVMKSPFISAAEIKRYLSSYLDKVSIDTIKRRMRIKFGMSSRKPSKKPSLHRK